MSLVVESFEGTTEVASEFELADEPSSEGVAASEGTTVAVSEVEPVDVLPSEGVAVDVPSAAPLSFEESVTTSFVAVASVSAACPALSSVTTTRSLAGTSEVVRALESSATANPGTERARAPVNRTRPRRAEHTPRPKAPLLPFEIIRISKKSALSFCRRRAHHQNRLCVHHPSGSAKCRWSEPTGGMILESGQTTLLSISKDVAA